MWLDWGSWQTPRWHKHVCLYVSGRGHAGSPQHHVWAAKTSTEANTHPRGMYMCTWMHACRGSLLQCILYFLHSNTLIDVMHRHTAVILRHLQSQAGTPCVCCACRICLCEWLNHLCTVPRCNLIGHLLCRVSIALSQEQLVCLCKMHAFVMTWLLNIYSCLPMTQHTSFLILVCLVWNRMRWLGGYVQSQCHPRPPMMTHHRFECMLAWKSSRD
jgi:hypothetical protein